MDDLTKYIEERKATDTEFAKDFDLGNAAFQKAYRFLIEMEERQGLTSNSLTGGDGIEFEREEVYIPLGLVERKKRVERVENEGSPEKGAELYEEKVTTISQDEFFDQLIDVESNKAHKIAIIGEPGSGKTTRLQKIAEWLIEETDHIPIWISLGALGQKTIREYLLEDWLRDAAQDLDAPPPVWKDSLLSMLQDGKIWLLLDGVDEMGVNNPLQNLASQLSEGWLRNAGVVLTCRLNVWEANRNDLYQYKFKVYRNLDLNREQISQFISNWFEYSDPETGKALNLALSQPGKERILNLVKNPLRLTLLCRTWEIYEKSLPDTKAELYRQFVEAHYDWNRQQTSYEQREKLNQALGQLALQAIDSKESRFRLRETFVRQVMDSDLFQLALDLGWLNRVGVAAENPGEKVYAFYHPTFQEYFAALVIEDWHFFLNHVPHNPEKGIYRVFEPQWREVILLWIGRTEILQETKKDFTKSLFDLESDPETHLWIYDIHAVFFAGILTAEYYDSEIASNVIKSIIQYAFGFFDKDKNKWRFFLDGISKKAKSVLLEVNKELAVQELQDLINNPEFKNKGEARAILKKILNPPSKPKEENPPSELQIGIEKDDVGEYLSQFYKDEEDDVEMEGYWNDFSERQSYEPLDRFDELTEFLSEQKGVETMKDKKDLELKMLLERIVDDPLSSINLQSFYNHPLSEDQINMIIDYFEDLIDTQDSSTLEPFVKLLDRQAAENPRYILIILKLLEQNHDNYYEYQFYYKSLVNSLKNPSEKAISDLSKLGIVGLKQIVSLVSTLINSQNREEFDNSIFHEVLLYCSQNLSYLDFYKAQNKEDFSQIDNILIGNTPTTQNLNQQFTDIASQLQPTTTTHPIVIDLETLAGETDQSAISQEFCYQIYKAISPQDQIPSVNNVYSLKPVIQKIKHQLQVNNIAFILQNGQPETALVTFCKKLSNAVHIAWITDSPLDPPLRGFPPQPNLVNILQNWLNEIP